jgi:hypothetical protein
MTMQEYSILKEDMKYDECGQSYASTNLRGRRETLRENRALPCVKNFAVRFLSGARQRASLSCVLDRTHGKQTTHGKK